MTKSYISLNFNDFKNKFDRFVIHRKKIKALENLNLTGRFHNQDELQLIKRCLNRGFLSQKAEAYLEEMIEEYELDYLHWTYKTKWLKGEIERLSRTVSPLMQPQLYFDFNKERKVSTSVPTYLLPQNSYNAYAPL